jgi:hypothetical protein
MIFDDVRHYLRKLLPLAWQRTGRNDPVSMVLLLRKPHFFTAAELRAAGERAWHTFFADQSSSSRHCVVQSKAVTIMKAGWHGLVFWHRDEPYFRLSEKQIIDWLPGEDQRAAWKQHRVWVAVDYMNKKMSVELAYCVIARLVAELLDENCTAVYTPRERSLAPNDSTLYLELVKIGSACDPGITPKAVPSGAGKATPV